MGQPSLGSSHIPLPCSQSADWEEGKKELRWQRALKSAEENKSCILPRSQSPKDRGRDGIRSVEGASRGV